MTAPQPHRRLGSRALPEGPLLLVAGALLAALTACGEEPESCRTTTDCSGQRACVGTVCRAVSCTSNLDCPVDAVCDLDQGLCGPAQCRTHDDCAGDRDTPYCVGGRCRSEAPPQCSQRAQCEDGERCDGGGSCVTVDPAGVCDEDEDCGNPQICDPDRGAAGACADPCTSESDCADLDDLRACDAALGLCVRVECLDHQDCGLDQECAQDHTCQIQRFPCDELVCDDPNRPFRTEPVENRCRCVQCFGPDHCNVADGETCTEGLRCLYCETTGDGPTDCPDALPVFLEGCCIECFDDSDCDALGLGAVCLNGRCQGCDCNAGCTCPEGSLCSSEPDGTGRCLLPLGQLGDSCTAQQECEDHLACSYASGQCAIQTSGGFCGTTGCPSPSRCANTVGGGVCYGCHPGEDECPPGFVCNVPSDWEGVFDGGQCIPG